jgi:hypothetical protein
MNNNLRLITVAKILLFTSVIISLCSMGTFAKSKTSEKKIGVLLVNHGSRSATWRTSLLALEENVRPPLLQNKDVKGIKTAFMEYTEPSIATRMKEFDAEGFTDVIIVPVFLTISSHTFDDIPTIISKKIDPQSMETLKIEKIERYSPLANTVITPTLDFTDILRKNILRRVQSLTKSAKDEGLVLIAYGDATYEKEWIALLDNVSDFVNQHTGISAHSYGWCGHLVHYDPQKTTDAIERVLESKKRAIVIPVLVAHDEMFQIKIIGDGISKIENNKNRVIYKPDSILPDENVEQWVINSSNEFVEKIHAEADMMSNK